LLCEISREWSTKSVLNLNTYFQVPSGGPPSLFIPQATNSTLQSCQMYQDPSNPSQGYQPCVEGHSFVFRSKNKWSIVAEVRWPLNIKDFSTPFLSGVWFVRERTLPMWLETPTWGEWWLAGSSLGFSLIGLEEGGLCWLVFIVSLWLGLGCIL
jgi:hypothetical protein